MSQSSALFRLESKIQAKNPHKSSLPKIQSQQNCKNKQFLAPSPLKIAFKNLRKLGRNHQQASNFTCRQMKVEKNENSILTDHHEHLSKLRRVFSKEIPKVDKKQLTTDCTLNIEQEINSNNDIKQADLKGMQMWALNKNLKQFSETRKVAFFKSNLQSKSNEKEKPLTERKPKKVSEIMLQRKHSQHQTNCQYSNFLKNKLPSEFLENSLYGTLPIRKQKSDANSGSFNRDKKAFSEKKIDSSNPQANSYLRTFVNGSHLKRQSSNKMIETLEEKGSTPKAANGEEIKKEKNKEKKPRNFRRNRFEKKLLEQNQFSQNVTSTSNSQNNPSTLNDPDNQAHKKQQQALLFTFQLATPLQKALVESPSNHFEEKKSQYQYSRSIQKINNSLLKNIDDYMDSYQTQSIILPSKIQFLVDSLSYPKSYGQNGQFRTTHRMGEGMGRLEDEFFFSDEKKIVENQKQKKGCLRNKSKKQKVGYKN